jgi:hypothetical protein
MRLERIKRRLAVRGRSRLLRPDFAQSPEAPGGYVGQAVLNWDFGGRWQTRSADGP